MNNDPTSILTPWTLLTATGALLAFTVGLYTLVGRERKSPYAINSAFQIFLLCLAGAICDMLGAVVPKPYDQGLLFCGAGLLIVALLVSFYHAYRTTIRFVYFIDDPHPRHFPLVRDFRQWRQLRKRLPSYAHNPVPLPQKFIDSLKTILAAQGQLDVRENLALQSLAVATEHQAQATELLGAMAKSFIDAGYSVQYMTASRHPIEFVRYLKEHIERGDKPWLDCKQQLVVVDAYTPHFGFVDSIYKKRDEELSELGVKHVRSSRTYAGMHTATSKAFKQIEKQMKKDERRPTLVIYEDCYALADLESVEQYRIFVRHVLPSERMWDAMFTVFVESAQADSDWKLLHSYTSMKLDLRPTPTATNGLPDRTHKAVNNEQGRRRIT